MFVQMYSRNEISRIKENFWTAFGRYLSLHLNSEGEKINWINYHTGFKNLYFRMEADQQTASLSIQITHPDEDKRSAYFEKFRSLKRLFENEMKEEWKWELNSTDEFNKPVSRISISIDGVNVLQQETWPAIISFLKPRIIRLDGFWNQVKDLFEELRYG